MASVPSEIWNEGRERSESTAEGGRWVGRGGVEKGRGKGRQGEHEGWGVVKHLVGWIPTCFSRSTGELQRNRSSTKLLAGNLLVCWCLTDNSLWSESSWCFQLINYQSCQQQFTEVCAQPSDVLLPLFPKENTHMHTRTNGISGCCDSSSWSHKSEVFITYHICLTAETRISSAPVTSSQW